MSVPKRDAFDDSVFADFHAPSAPASLAQDAYPRTVYVPRTSSTAKPTH